jgi:hypothetical protein
MVRGNMRGHRGGRGSKPRRNEAPASVHPSRHLRHLPGRAGVSAGQARPVPERGGLSSGMAIRFILSL